MRDAHRSFVDAARTPAYPNEAEAALLDRVHGMLHHQGRGDGGNALALVGRRDAHMADFEAERFVIGVLVRKQTRDLAVGVFCGRWLCLVNDGVRKALLPTREECRNEKCVNNMLQRVIWTVVGVSVDFIVVFGYVIEALGVLLNLPNIVNISPRSYKLEILSRTKKGTSFTLAFCNVGVGKQNCETAGSSDMANGSNVQRERIASTYGSVVEHVQPGTGENCCRHDGDKRLEEF